MEFILKNTKISLSPLFFAVLTAFLLIDKNGIAFPVIIFSILHELGHFLMLLLIKTRPNSVKLSVFGIHMELLQNLSTEKKCAVLISGFTVNFILAAILFILGQRQYGYISLFIGIFTALPLSSTDGGGVLYSFLEEFSPEKSDKTMNIINSVFSVLVAVIFSAAAIYGKNYYLFIAVIYILIKILKISL